MPIILKPNQMYYKDPDTGDYKEINVLAEETTATKVAEINAAGANEVTKVQNAGTTEKNKVDTAGATQLAAIQTKADEVTSQLASAGELEGMLAEAFSPSTNYTAGQYIIQSVTVGGNTVNKLFRFTADHAAGEWIGTDAVEIKLGDEVTDLKSALDKGFYASVVYSRNMLDKTTADLGLLKNDGTVGSSTSFYTSDYIPIGANTNYRVLRYNNRCIDTAARAIMYYDSAKAPLLGTSINDQIGSGTTVADTAYIRISFTTTYYDSIMLFIGDLSNSSQYIPYSAQDVQYLGNNVDLTANIAVTPYLDDILGETTEAITLGNAQIGNFYVNAQNLIARSNVWIAYLLYPIYDKITVTYVSNGTYAIINFYSDTNISDDSYLGGIHGTSGTHTIELLKSSIPAGTKCIIINSRDNPATDTAITVTYHNADNRLDHLDIDVKRLISAEKGEDMIARVYKNVPNSNDFAVIRDEIWFAENIYQDGVATDFTTVHRYKINDGFLAYIGDIDTDFGHWNSVDYNEENDCLIFGNGANSVSTEGNYFVVVPHPLSLGAYARIADVGIKYDVDIGFKVQAVWGDPNLGRHNIVYLISNSCQKITKVFLMRDANGDFVGDYITLESHDIELDKYYGVGGSDFWGDTLYIGIGGPYEMFKMSMTDYSIQRITKHYYNDDGTEMSGSTQGVHVDSKHLWVFSNIAGSSNNYLIVYNR